MDARAQRQRLPETLLPAVGYTCLALYFARRAAVGGEAFFERDIHLMWFAQMRALGAAVRSGSWPVWNPWIGFGQPLWADANNQVLYPTTLLQAVLPPWHAYTGLVVLHLIVAGVGLYRLARHLGLGRGPAFAAGAFWLCSGPLLSLVRAWNLLSAAAWLPWGVIAADTARTATAPAKAIMAWGACLALPILAGGPEMLLASLVLQAAVLAARTDRTRPELARMAVRGATAAVFGLALSAGQWLPALDAARRSGRAALPLAVRTYWSEHPLRLVEWVIPWSHSALPAGSPLRERLFEGRDPFLASIYMGAAAAGLLVAAWMARARLATALAGVGALAALVALGRHLFVYGVLVSLVPPLRLFRYPAKALVLASLCWALLAALGLEALAAADETARRRARRLVVSSAAILVPVSALVLARGDLRFLAGAWTWTAAALAALAAAALFSRRDRLGGRAAVTVIAALVTLDLVWAHADLNPTAPTSLYRSRPPVLAHVSADVDARVFAFDYLQPGLSARLLGRPDPYRLVRAPGGWSPVAAHALGLRWVLFPPTAAAGFLSGSFDADVPAIAPAATGLLSEVSRHVEGPSLVRLLQFGAVGSVVTLHEQGLGGLSPVATAESLFAEPVRLWRVPLALPRAYAVGDSVTVDGAEGLVRALDPAFDLRRSVVVDRGPELKAPANHHATARLVELTTDRAVVEVETNAPAHVVLADAFDPVWSARVDGAPAAVKRANGVFRAVAVPAGRHRVEFVCRPVAVVAGLAVSALALAAAAAVGLRARSRT